MSDASPAFRSLSTSFAALPLRLGLIRRRLWLSLLQVLLLLFMSLLQLLRLLLVALFHLLLSRGIGAPLRHPLVVLFLLLLQFLPFLFLLGKLLLLLLLVLLVLLRVARTWRSGLASRRQVAYMTERVGP